MIDGFFGDVEKNLYIGEVKLIRREFFSNLFKETTFLQEPHSRVLKS